VGGDGFIGQALYQACKARGAEVFVTTRRCNRAAIQIDLSQPIDTNILPHCDVAYLCAAISRFSTCERNPILARRVNITAQLELARNFFSRGTHVVFLSSNAVFDGRAESPNEDARLSPISFYGQLKSYAEEELEVLAKQYSGDLSIVRLTKVLSSCHPLISKWVRDLRAKTAITAFSDKNLSPISLDYAVKGLIQCGAVKVGGTFHLSGKIELSFHALANLLARSVGAAQKLVLAESTNQFPMHNRLGMNRTELKLSIQAQNLESLVADLVTSK